MREADQLIAGALRDIAAEAGLPRPVADAAWRAGRRRRLATLAASAASVAGTIALALAVLLPMASAPGPAAPARPSVQLVSITLSPVTPARTDVLAAAASILRQRAAQLHLPSIRAQISGADVVLTGPEADETQLKTLTQSGMVNLRQVLLYQPAAGAPTYGDASLVNHDTLALFGELVCTPANASTWKGQVGYNVAGAYDNPDTQIVSCDSSGGKYALDVATVQDTQISNATAELPTTSNQQEVMLTLNRAGASAFGTLTSHLFSTYASGPGAGNGNDLWLDAVAFVLDGNVVSALHIEGPIRDGKFSITDNFTREQAEELAAQLRSGPLPADFRISAISTSG